MKKNVFCLMLSIFLFLFHSNSNSFAADTNFKSENKIQNYINLENASISKPMTFEQLVHQYASDSGITYEEAKKIFNYYPESSISLYSDTKTYNTITTTLNVSNNYKPSLRYYCMTSEYKGGWHGIVKILAVNMNRGYNGKSYAFGGTVYSHLVNANKIFYIVNGDFYSNSTSTITSSINIGIGQKGSVSFGVSSTSNHYKYFYVEDNLIW